MSANADIFFLNVLELIDLKYKIKRRCKFIGNSNNINMEKQGG